MQTLVSRCRELGLQPCNESEKVIRKKVQAADEAAFKERDPDYYNTVKSVISFMPDIRPFKTKIASDSAEKWTMQKRWQAILEDVTRLDTSGDRGDTFAANYIDWLNENRASEGILKKDNLLDFFATYPALSWVIMMTQPKARCSALDAGYDRWIDQIGIADIPDIEIVKIVYCSKSPDLISYLLNPYTFDELKAIKTKDGSSLMKKAIDMRRAALLVYLLERGFRIDPKEYLRVLKFIDGASLKIIDRYQPDFLRIDYFTVKIAITNSDVEMLRYLLKKDKNEVLEFMLSYLEDHPVHISKMVRSGNLELIKTFINAGVNLVYFNSYAGLNLGILKYFISIGLSPVKQDPEYPRNKPAFINSVYEPESLLYIIENYEDQIVDEVWNEALLASIGYDFDREDFINKPPVESLKILLSKHNYSYNYLKDLLRNLPDKKEEYFTIIYNSSQEKLENFFDKARTKLQEKK